MSTLARLLPHESGTRAVSTLDRMIFGKKRYVGGDIKTPRHLNRGHLFFFFLSYVTLFFTFHQSKKLRTFEIKCITLTIYFTIFDYENKVVSNCLVVLSFFICSPVCFVRLEF